MPTAELDPGEHDPAEVFRDGLALGELRYRRCRWCADRSAQLRLLCATCGGTEFDWERSSGQGRIYRMAESTGGGAAGGTAVVELAEGFRMSARLVPVPAHRLWPGAPVRLEVTEDGGALRPAFRAVAA